ncbi:MAG: hypothetical protein WDA71_11805, partial [Actinomycetota bacterium]
GRVILMPQHFMVLVAGPILAIGLMLFLRLSPYGVALRAAAENAPRARLLGIPVKRVSTMAWVIAALLSGAASILLAPIIGFSATEAVGLPILMRGLAAAMIARMESVGVAFGVGLGLGVLDQLVFFWTGRSGLTDLVLLIAILAVLLGRRRVTRRTTSSEESSWEVAEPVRPLPVEIARHPRWRVLSLAGVFVMVAAVLASPYVFGASTTFLLATIFLVSVVAVSMTVLTGWAGQMSVGQWALAGIGGVFGSKLVTGLGWPFWVSLVVAAMMGGLIAFILGLPALRLEGVALAVVTLGFAVTAASWLFGQPWFSGNGFLPRPEYLTTRGYYFVALALMVLTVLATRSFQRTRIGRNMIAVRDNPSQASAFGVGVSRTKLTAFVMSGVFAAAAGFLWSSGVGVASGPVFPPVRSLSIVSAVVIGGLGSVGGAILGAFYMLGIPYFGTRISPYIGLLSTGFGLLALVLFLPGGLVRLLFSARDILARLVTGTDPRPDVVPVSVGELEAARAGLGPAADSSVEVGIEAVSR